MINKKVKGFTLVELLAVIVILAIILVIAVPKIISVIEDSKKATLESTAKMIASSAEKQKVQNTILGNSNTISCDSVAKINKGDYADCSIEFDGNTAKVTITGSGKFEGLNICEGTKTNANAQKEECGLVCKKTEQIITKLTSSNIYSIKDYDKCVSYMTEKIVNYESNHQFDDGTLWSELVPSMCNAKSGEEEYGGMMYGDFVQGLVYYYQVITPKELVENGVVEGTLEKSCVANGPEYMTKVCPANTDCSINNLMRDSDGNIRYIGNNPNNYIEFNNEVWRIVGAFNVKKNASDTTTEMRLKLIKNESIGRRAYHSTNDATWGTSDLKTYLNGDYYNSLTTTAKGQIEKVVWNTGTVAYGEGPSGPSPVYANNAYEDEKKIQTVEGIVGLIAVSDYAYANGNVKVVGTDFSTAKCTWMCDDMWTITKIGATATCDAWNTSSNGYSWSNGSLNATINVRPVVYLKSNVKLTGTGENTPEGIYKIS